ncbi:hypothetical protein ACPCJT_02675 [Streptomyces griseoincarnatus]
MPTKVIRSPEGKQRPRDAAWFTLYPRRWTLRAARAVGRRWRSYRTGREARRSIVPNRRWHPWRVSLGRLLRVFAFVGTALLLTWIALAAYDSSQNERSWFHDVRQAAWFSTVLSFVSPVLTGALLLAVFLLYWYHKAKRPLVRKARTRPHELVPTAGTLVDRIVGRRELAQVMAQTLRNRETRRPYLLVGGVGVGKTAVLVELTRMLAQQSAVPVPLRLRDMDGEFDFEQMARRRFAGWTSLHPRAQRLLADVLIMLNLTERDGSPDAIEERLELTDRRDLPPCLTHDRTPLHPERSVGRNDQDEPGSTCLPTCTFRLCPYPPKAARTQKEIEEPFCRQQQALLHSHRRWHLPALTRRTAPWVSIPVRELQAFWEVMAHRKRKAPEEDEQVL